MIEILNGIHETVTYNDMSGIRLYLNEESEDYPIHWHIALEIIMPLENTYTVQLGNQTLTLTENDILLIAPGELHTLIAPPLGKRLIIQVDTSLLCSLNKMDSLLHLLHPYKMINYVPNDQFTTQLNTYLREIEQEYTTAGPFVESAIYSLLLSFFVAIGRASLTGDAKFPEATPSKQYEYIEKFMDICKYITTHCTENITVDHLAIQAGFSKFHFSRLFKQFTGLSCYDYLTTQRLNYAEKLLMSPDLSITDVAMQSGFNSLSTFNRIFKTAKNCTPTEYKRLGPTHHIKMP